MPAPSATQAVEARMLAHVLAMHQALLEVGISELAEGIAEDAAEDDLAQWITAVFRRTLPALRISSKWLRANYKYVVQSHSSDDYKARDSRGGSFSAAAAASEELNAAILQFWTKYAKFSTMLSHTFPAERLPTLSTPLEEDIEMRGFLPLRQMMGDAKNAGGEDAVNDFPSKTSSSEDQVHPNEEQLMRIADLLNDAKILADTEASVVDHFHDLVTDFHHHSGCSDCIVR